MSQELQQLIANAKKGGDITTALSLSDTDYILLFTGTGWKKIQKKDITFNGQPATTFLELNDTPTNYLGQAGKAMVVKADESGLEYKTIGEIVSLTKEDIETILGYTPANDSEVVKSVNGELPVNGDVTIDLSGSNKKPITQEWEWVSGNSQVFTLKYSPIDSLVRIYVQGIRIYKGQYSQLSERQVEILDTLSDGNMVAIDYEALVGEIITLLLLTPEGGIEDWSVSRNSTATYIDNTGTFKTATINTARIDHSTGSARVLVEPEATNKLLYTNDFTNAEWIKVASATVIGDYGISPDGTQNADRFNFTITSSNDRLAQFSPLDGSTSGLTFVFSVWVKKLAGHTAGDIRLGLMEYGGAVGFKDTFKTITPTDNWVRHSFSFTIVDNDRTDVQVQIRSNSTSGVMDLLLFEAQLEQDVLTSNIPNTNAYNTRSADVIQIGHPIGTVSIKETIDGATTTTNTIPDSYQLPQGNISLIEMTGENYEHDLIAELGQSNMQGEDGDTTNPDYPFSSTNGYYFGGATHFPITTNRGGANGGSQANYFAEKYFALTGRKAVMLEGAKGGSGLTSTSKPDPDNWSASGNLRGLAETLISNACAFYGKTKPTAALWAQGERDAQEIDSNGTYTKAMVKTAMQDVINWWQTNYPNTPFLISELGDTSDGANTQGWQDVRAVHNEIVAENTNVYIAFTGAKNFWNEGKMSDNLHYNYVGYKEMGEAFATKLSEL